MSGFKDNNINNLNFYLEEIFQRYISQMDSKTPNIAIIDGENLLGYYVDDRGRKYQIQCGDSMYIPILDILSEINAINKDTLIVITQKRNNNLCSIRELELIKQNSNVYIFVMQDHNVLVNIGDEVVNLSIVNTLTSTSYNLPKNHYIKGYDDFVGYYIFSYFYYLSKGDNRVRNVFYYSGDTFRDVDSYVRNLNYYLAPEDRTRFNNSNKIPFNQFNEIRIYSANSNQFYYLTNNPSIKKILYDSEKEYTKETIKGSDMCKYFERQDMDKTIRTCIKKVDLQIHILGDPKYAQKILQTTQNLFSSRKRKRSPGRDSNSAERDKYYTRKYLKYKTKYLQLKNM